MLDCEGSAAGRGYDYRGEVRRQEAHLPLQGPQEGGQEGVQGVRDLHLAPRRAQCRLFAAAARSTGRVVPVGRKMVLVSAEEKPIAVSSQTRPSARGLSIQQQPSSQCEGEPARKVKFNCRKIYVYVSMFRFQLT